MKYSPESATKSTSSSPTVWRSSSKPETLRLEAGRYVSALGA